MKLDRNTNNNGRGKYAVLRLREWPHGYSPECQQAFEVLQKAGAIDFGNTPETDFFLIRLKDKFAGPALHAYAEAARADDPEYAAEVDALAQAADRRIPKRMPD